jgi:multiple sugar transport system substrate-binding protein
MKPSPRIRTVAAVVGMIAVVGVLAGCTPASAPKPSTSAKASVSTAPVTITFWDNNGGPSRTPIYQELIRRFEAKYPYITVDYVGVPAAQSQQKYETAVAGGSVPDVGVVNSTQGFSDLIEQHALEPLDKLLAASPLKSQMAPDALKGARDSSPDGKLYVMPATENTDIIWYNSTLFKKAGVSAPTTWSNFYADAKKLTNKSKGQYGFAMRGGAGGIGQLVADIVSCAGLPAFLDSKGNSLLNSPAVVSCVKQFASLYGTATSQADLSYAYPDMISAFDSGSAAMVQHNLGSALNHVSALGAGVAVATVLPENDKTKKRTLLASSTDGPAIFSASTHKAAAWTFVQYLLSHESNSYWNENVGQIPTNLLARKDDWVGGQAWVSTASAALNTKTTTVVAPPTYLPEWGPLTNDLQPDFQSVLLGKETAAQFVKKFSDGLTAASKNFQKSK